jgi:hypothetical protein
MKSLNASFSSINTVVFPAHGPPVITIFFIYFLHTHLTKSRQLFFAPLWNNGKLPAFNVGYQLSARLLLVCFFKELSAFPISLF